MERETLFNNSPSRPAKMSALRQNYCLREPGDKIYQTVSAYGMLQV